METTQSRTWHYMENRIALIGPDGELEALITPSHEHDLLQANMRQCFDVYLKGKFTGTYYGLEAARAVCEA